MHKSNKSIYIRNENPVALIVSSYQPNKFTSDVLRSCINSYLRINNQNASLWIVDVGSPNHEFLVKPSEYKNINFVISDHQPRSWSGIPFRKKLLSKLLLKKKPRSGSYANGFTLNLGYEVFQEIQYNPEFVMTLQSDVLFTKKTILEDLINLFDKETAAVGVREQPNFGQKVNILHSLGCLWKNSVLRELGGDFMPNMPEWDVGEKIINSALNFGYKTKSLECTHCVCPNYKEAIKKIVDTEVKNLENVDRCINENGQVLFMHLGRGIQSSINAFSKKKLTLEKWEKIGLRLLETQN